jgi:class 3 adenylate cyclase
MTSAKSIGPPGPGQTKPVGERRQVTVLFYDIVNSTLLLNSLDPEDFGELQRVIHLTAAAIIERNGGHLERLCLLRISRSDRGRGRMRRPYSP